MSKRSPVAIFLAASALLSVNGIQAKVGELNGQKIVDLEQGHQVKKKSLNQDGDQLANNKNQKEENIGGIKEWTTDQSVNEEGKLDESAKEAAKKAKKENACNMELSSR